MSITVLLSQNHFSPFFSFFGLPLIDLIKDLKPLYFHFNRVIITSLFRKLTKVSTNTFNIDINRISGRLNIHCAKILFLLNLYLSTNKQISFP